MSWKREPLTEDELDQLIDTANRHGLKEEFTVRILAHTGLRAGELAHMTSDWVEWQSERLRVPTAEGDWTPKTPHSARTIPVKHPDTLRVIREFFKRREKVGVSRRQIYNRVVKVAQDTDIQKKVTPHVLRHTYGTLIAARGATPQYIRQTMGHADLSTASDYIAYSGSQLDEEAERLFSS